MGQFIGNVCYEQKMLGGRGMIIEIVYEQFIFNVRRKALTMTKMFIKNILLRKT
jgi:hypothetical protein